MDVEQISDAVTGAVAEVQPALPQRHARIDVQVCAAGPLGKNSHRQIYGPLEDKGKMLFFRIGQRTDGDGARNIRSAGEIVTAGIHQQKSPCLNGYIALGRGLIVDNGAVHPVSRDRLEARVKRAGFFSPRKHVVCDGQLRKRLTESALRFFRGLLLDPVYGLYHGGPVGEVCTMQVFDLGFIFSGGHKCRGSVARNEARLLRGLSGLPAGLSGLIRRRSDSLADSIRDLLWIGQDFLPRCEPGERVEKAFIWLQRDARGRQVISDF